MKWSEAASHYLEGCGNSPAAASEKFLHLKQGIQYVTSRVELQELDNPDTEKFTVPGQDYVDLPPDFVNLITVVNVTTGYKLRGEPNGFRGRMSFVEPETGMPPEGEPTHWVTANNRLYLRDTPDEIYTLKIVAKSVDHFPTQETYNVEIPIDPQFHLAVVYAAIVSFLTIHPKVVSELAQDGGDPLGSARAARDEALSTPQPKRAEKADREDRFYLRSYRLSGRM